MVIASVVGFIGNKRVALFRMRVGREIGSAALVADGHHARVDGLTSLAVLVGAIWVWLGYPLADQIVELVITAAILRIVVETSKSVFARLLDGVEPEVLDEVRSVSSGTDGVKGVADVRVRWLGHRMVAEVNIAVAPAISVEKGRAIAQEVHHNLLHHLRYLSSATIHVDPEGSAGEEQHQHSNYHQGEEDQHGHIHVDGHEQTVQKAPGKAMMMSMPSPIATLMTLAMVNPIRLSVLRALSHFRLANPTPRLDYGA